jgi:tagaturonate reductase
MQKHTSILNSHPSNSAMKKLNRQTVSTIQRPVKVLQFGEGNFLRGFADWIIDVLNEKTDFNGDVQIIQPRAHSHHKGQMINDQDGLYHVVIKGIKNGEPVHETRLITCVQQVINAYHHYSEFLRAGENPSLQFMISNTTEAGITFSEGDISQDAVPETFPGKLTALLYHRYQYFNGATDKGLFHLPCELLERNGDELKARIIQYCQAWKLPQEFINWINQHNTFCNTLVDRIVPGFPKDSIEEIKQQTGYDDALVVMAEPYYVWVIEASGDISKKLPTAAAELNIQFVNDLAPHRTLKVRILNGAHTIMTPVGFLKGLRTVQQVMEDNWTSSFISSVIQKEILPTLAYPPATLETFARDVHDRFKNPAIRHELASIALNSISKFKVRVLPTLLAYQKENNSLPEKIVFALASLILFYRGRWKGEATPINDHPDIITFFQEAWKNEDIVLMARDILGNKLLWDQDLNLVPGLTESVGKHIKEIQSQE